MSWLCSTAGVNKIHKLNHCHVCAMVFDTIVPHTASILRLTEFF